MRQPLAAGLAARTLVGALLLAAAAQTRPLVYCADASPEGFDPGLWDFAATGNVNAQMFQGPITHPTIYLPMLREIQGFVMSPSGKVDFEDVWR
jgi:ABC-type transport system substrate-binding protein